VRVYAPAVAFSATSPNGGGASIPSKITRRRRPPSAAEQARRKAWGAKYGATMRQIKQEHDQRKD